MSDAAAAAVLGAIGEVFLRFQHLEQIPRNYGTEDLLYPAEIHTMEFIGDHPETGAKEVAAHLRVTKGAVSQMVRKLVDKGLIAQNRRPEDRSRSALTLTDQGRVAHGAHKDLHERMARRFSEHIGPITNEAAERVVDICRRVIADLDRAIETDWLP